VLIEHSTIDFALENLITNISHTLSQDAGKNRALIALIYNSPSNVTITYNNTQMLVYGETTADNTTKMFCLQDEELPSKNGVYKLVINCGSINDNTNIVVSEFSGVNDNIEIEMYSTNTRVKDTISYDLNGYDGYTYEIVKEVN
jgi:hypothetical protein